MTRNADILPLDATPARQKLQPGDAWTFIFSDGLGPQLSTDTGDPAQVGETICEVQLDGSHMFRVTAVHEPATYETVYLGCKRA